MTRFSRRVSTVPPNNRLASAIERARDEGRTLIDLTLSNPTRAGIEIPVDDVAAALARGGRASYDPCPLGLPAARRTLAARLRCDPDDLVLTASTSEAYSYLFKLLADPGGEILSARPSYPLLDHLASIESCTPRQFPLSYEGRRGWRIEMDSVREGLSDATRAVIVVHPNNPTGSFVNEAEARSLAETCAEQDLALVSDEVFLPYPLSSSTPPSSLSDLDLPCLTFALGGLSKSAGMPHLKLAWIRLGGPGDLKRQARERIELIADNFLSVATPVQTAIDDLLDIGERIRVRIQERIQSNLAVIRKAVASRPHSECLTVDGGWSAVLRVPRFMSDEDLVIRLLEGADVLVHPGYFFDFEWEGVIVVSLLGDRVAEGIERVLQLVGEETR